MKAMMLLLVSAVALLVDPAVANPVTQSRNLDEIIQAAKKYNESLYKEFFVEDVEPLFHDGCNDEFFCKVHDILHGHAHFGKKTDQAEKKIVGILKTFVRNRNCTNPVNVTSEVRKPISDLVDTLVKCIQKRNLNGN